MSWTAVTVALALLVLDFKDARPCLVSLNVRQKDCSVSLEGSREGV